MTCFDPNPDLRWLFCFTHPDDEIAMAGWLRILSEAGVEVHVVWTHSTPRRESESRRAMELIGIPAERLTFLGATDQHVVDEIPDLLPRFAEIGQRLTPDRVVCGAFEQGHIDHDATNFLVNKSMDRYLILEFPLYHPYSRRLQTINRFAAPEGQEVLTLSKTQQRQKVQIGKSYPSQRIWTILWWYEALGYLTFSPKRLFADERLRVQTHRDFSRPNLPEKLADEVRASSTWKRWLNAVSPHL